jgi:archaellum component FlaG (FlaF/FlaG flagellin family)
LASEKGLAALVAVACLISAVVGSALTLALIQRSQQVSTVGTVVAVNVGVFLDVGCSQNASLAPHVWGVVYPGGGANWTIYVKATGNAPVTLGMAASGWVPTGASAFLSLSWDREGAHLNPGQVLNATLVLSVAPDVNGVTDFSFNVIITGSG